MRIASMQIFNVVRQSMSDVNQDLVKTQEQMSTGKRIQSPGDDPVAAAKILQITDELNAVDQYKRNIDIAQNNIALEESILGGVNNVIQRMQEMAIAAGNTATLTASDYRSMASEVTERIDEMVHLLNSRNANGDYIFGGYKSSEPPFAGSTEEGFVYRGDDGQQYMHVANNTSIATTDSGKALFMDVQSVNKTVQTSVNPTNQSEPPLRISLGQVVNQEVYDEFYPKDMIITFDIQVDGSQTFTAVDRSSGRVIDGLQNAPYISGEEIQIQGVSFRVSGTPVAGDQVIIESTEKQGILNTLARFKEAMLAYDNSPEKKEELSEIVGSTLSNLKNAQASTLDVMSSIGGRVNTLDSTRDLHADTELLSKDVMSQLRDVDYAEAATRLSEQSMILQAAQQAFLRVSQLTLFSRL
jgi:flagellar hook-associated protein 3 FlgL